MIGYKLYEGLDGECTICQVRSAENPQGKWWHVHCTLLDERSGRTVYDGPDEEIAWKKYEKTKLSLGEYP